MATNIASQAPGGNSNRPNVPQSSADRLLLACFHAIKKETGWVYRTLRGMCDWAIGELERDSSPGTGLKRYYRVLELALESRAEEVVEVSLAQLQKLIGENEGGKKTDYLELFAGGLVPRGMRITLKDGSEINLGEELVDIVLRAGAGDTTVRLGGRAQAVRCLLACVASPEIEFSAIWIVGTSDLDQALVKVDVDVEGYVRPPPWKWDRFRTRGDDKEVFLWAESEFAMVE